MSHHLCHTKITVRNTGTPMNNGERMIQIEIPGNPVPKGRHRTTKSGHSYTPTKTKKWEQIARLMASDQMKGQDPMSGAIDLIVSAFFAIPKSWPKWKKDAAEKGLVVHTSRPDYDNILKAAADALNGIVFYDDSQIFNGYTNKMYSTKPCVKIIAIEVNTIHSKTKKRVIK